MKKHSNLKAGFIGFASGIILIPSIVGATAVVEKISATLNKDVNITWNNEAFVPKDDDGTILYPIMYKGRSYLPVKYIAEKAGVKVDWDRTTKTIILTQDVEETTEAVKEAVGLGTLNPVYMDFDYYVKRNEPFDFRGNKMIGENSLVMTSSRNISYALDGQYGKFEASAGLVDGAKDSVQISIMDENNTVLYSHTFVPSDVADKISINVKGVQTLKIETKTMKDSGYTSYSTIFDAKLYK